MLYEPNNALIAQQMAAKAVMPLPPRADWRAETVQLNPREEYGRLIAPTDYRDRDRQAKAVADTLKAIAEGLAGH